MASVYFYVYNTTTGIISFSGSADESSLSYFAGAGEAVGIGQYDSLSYYVQNPGTSAATPVLKNLFAITQVETLLPDDGVDTIIFSGVPADVDITAPGGTVYTTASSPATDTVSWSCLYFGVYTFTFSNPYYFPLSLSIEVYEVNPWD